MTRSQAVKDALTKQDAALGTTWKNNTTGGIVAVSILVGTLFFGAAVIFALRGIVPIF